MLRTLVTVFSSLCISLVLGCGSVTGPVDAPTDPKISEDELAIFSVILKDLPPNQCTIGGSPHDAFGLTIENIKELFPEISADTYQNFARRNTKPIVVEGEYLIRPGYSLVPNQSVDADKTYRYYAFSRVGFRRDRKQAFVYFINVCEPLCSRGAFYLLEEPRGKLASRKGRGSISILIKL